MQVGSRVRRLRLAELVNYPGEYTWVYENVWGKITEETTKAGKACWYVKWEGVGRGGHHFYKDDLSVHNGGSWMIE
jgi:hypothetical protein